MFVLQKVPKSSLDRLKNRNYSIFGSRFPCIKYQSTQASIWEWEFERNNQSKISSI